MWKMREIITFYHAICERRSEKKGIENFFLFVYFVLFVQRHTECNNKTVNKIDVKWTTTTIATIWQCMDGRYGKYIHKIRNNQVKTVLTLALIVAKYDFHFIALLFLGNIFSGLIHTHTLRSHLGGLLQPTLPHNSFFWLIEWKLVKNGFCYFHFFLYCMLLVTAHIQKNA